MFSKTVEVEKRQKGGYVAYYIVTTYRLLGIPFYTTTVRKV